MIYGQLWPRNEYSRHEGNVSLSNLFAHADISTSISCPQFCGKMLGKIRATGGSVAAVAEGVDTSRLGLQNFSLSTAWNWWSSSLPYLWLSSLLFVLSSSLLYLWSSSLLYLWSFSLLYLWLSSLVYLWSSSLLYLWSSSLLYLWSSSLLYLWLPSLLYLWSVYTAVWGNNETCPVTVEILFEQKSAIFDDICP